MVRGDDYVLVGINHQLDLLTERLEEEFDTKTVLVEEREGAEPEPVGCNAFRRG